MAVFVGPAMLPVESHTVVPTRMIPEVMAADGEDLRAALLHEMAHVLRRDYAVNLVCEVLTLPVCWHPALMALKAARIATSVLP